jgi:hypothetical protein
MRLLRVLFCVLVLAAVAAAQSSSSTPASGSATAPPQNPLSEPPTAQQQQQQQQAEQANKPTSFDVGAAATAQEDQELGEVRMMTRYTQIGGSPEGRARSFHNDGSNNLAEVNYFVDRRFFGTAHRMQFLTMFRGTDDNSIDPEKNSVQKAFLRFYSPTDETILGDALINYSRLSFNQNIKGISETVKVNDKFKVSLTTGVFIDRYGSLFKDQPLRQGQFLQNGVLVNGMMGCVQPAGYTGNFLTLNDPQCGRPYTSWISGARLEYAFARDSAIGLNLSTSDDLMGTRREQPFNTSPSPITNRVGSVDMKWQAGMLRVDSEYAYSFTNFDARYGTCVAPCDSRVPTPGLGYQGDWGGRFEMSWRHHKLSVRSSYVRFQPNFASMNARQISDLQDMLVRISYDLTDFLTIDGTARRSNDDLKGQLPYQKTMWGPEGRLIFHDLPFYRRANFEIGYRHRIIDGFNGTIPASGLLGGCVAGNSGMTCVDRFVRTPYAEFTMPIKTTFLTLGYERRQTVDAMQPGGTSNTDRVYAGLRGIYDLGGWHFNPSLRYELERQGSRPGLNNVPPGGFASPIDLFLLRESNRLATASLYMETPRWFIVELAFRDNSATTLSGYSRPSYRANLTYKIANDENKLFIFSFERNSNFYFSDQYPPGGLLNPINFDERMMGVTFVYKFGKRAR